MRTCVFSHDVHNRTNHRRVTEGEGRDAERTRAKTARSSPCPTVVSDPKAIDETIAGRDVTVVKRGDDWVTLSWTQGDIFLTLTSPYDVLPTIGPFGPSSHPRFTPDQLRRIVASVR